MNRCSTYPEEQVLFMDEVIVNFSLLKAYKIKSEKKVKIYVGITKEGKLIEPLLQYSLDIGFGKIPSFTSSVFYTYTDDSIVALNTWIENCLTQYTKSRPALLFLDAYNFHISKDFLSLLTKINVEVLFLPEGSSCILNPLRKIAPKLQASIMEMAMQMESGKHTRKEVKQGKIQEWITKSLENLVETQADLFGDAFNFLKSSNLAS